MVLAYAVFDKIAWSTQFADSYGANKRVGSYRAHKRVGSAHCIAAKESES